MFHNTPVHTGWKIVALLWFAFFLNYVDRQVAFSIFPALRKDLGFTAVELGLVGTVFLWVYSLTMPVAGRLADIWSRKNLVLGSLVLWSLATWGTAISESVGSFLFWRGAMGVTEALYFPAAVALIAGAHGEQTRSRALGLHQSAQLFGGAVGGWYGGWSADVIGWQRGLEWLAGLGVVYAAVLWFTLRETPRRTVERSVQDGGTGWKSGAMQLLLTCFFFFCGVLWMLYAWLPDHVYSRLGLSMTASGVAGTLALQASSFLGILAGGYLGDRTGRRWVVAAAGLLLSPMFAYAAFAADSLLGVTLAATGFGLTGGLLMANVFACAYEAVGEKHFGLASGLLNAAGGLAGGAGMFLAGYFRDSLGVSTLVFTAAVPTMICAAILLKVALRRPAAVPQLMNP